MDMSSGILRQRRNLMGISIFLPIFLFSGITLETISFFGNRVSVNNPQIITISLIVLFVYFSLRYYQYFTVENHVQSFRKEIGIEIKNKITRLLESRVKRKMGDLYEKGVVHIRLPTEYALSQNFDTAGLPKQMIHSANIFNNNFVAIVRIFDPKEGNGEPSEKVKTLLQEFRDNPYWEQTSRTTNQEILPEMFQTEIDCSWFELAIVKCKTWCSYFVHTTSITNYYLPFFMASISSFFTLYWLMSVASKT